MKLPSIQYWQLQFIRRLATATKEPPKAKDPPAGIPWKNLSVAAVKETFKGTIILQFAALGFKAASEVSCKELSAFAASAMILSW